MPTADTSTPDNSIFRAHAAFWIILLVAAGIRLIGLFKFCLDWDESNVLSIALLPLERIIPMTMNWELHPPGTHLLLHFWTSVLGSTDVSVRIFAWFFGLLGLAGTYFLALRISKSRTLAALTMLLSVASPMLFRYSQVSTMYVVEYVGVMFSWAFLLGLLEDQTRGFLKQKTFWLYAVSTLVMLWAHSLGPFVLAMQGLYLWLIRKKLAAGFFKRWLVAAGILLLPNLYHIWLKLQPWSLANAPEQKDIHGTGPFWFFLLAPINLLFLGYDVRDLGSLPTLPVLLAYGTGGYTLMMWTWWALEKTAPDKKQLVLCLGVYPIVILYFLAGIFGLAVFHMRTLLYCLSAFHFLLAGLAITLWSQQKKQLASALIAGLVILQVLPTFQRQPSEDAWRYLASEIKKDLQPTDGIVVYPGWSHIGLFRYLDPAKFGFTTWELSYDPKKENYFHMFHGADERYFLVSGEDILTRPDIAARFAGFQKQHPRIWLVSGGYPPALTEQLDCTVQFMALIGTRFMPTDCHGSVKP